MFSKSQLLSVRDEGMVENAAFRIGEARPIEHLPELRQYWVETFVCGFGAQHAHVETRILPIPLGSGSTLVERQHFCQHPSSVTGQLNPGTEATIQEIVKRDEIRRYLEDDLEKTHKDFNVLALWNGNGQETVTSTDAEHNSNVGGLQITSLWHNLSQDSFCAAMALGSWYDAGLLSGTDKELFDYFKTK
ncbi:hypothetical protein BT69DRAFT_1291693 [Atractiella rhizophila]|nr:hypothetical protein BT69DRAFT_1291693 [Atractiella rhizophila]